MQGRGKNRSEKLNRGIKVIGKAIKNKAQMGLLKDLGPIQDFQTTQNLQKEVKSIGLRQFWHILKRYSTWTKPMVIEQIKWGQEIEGHFLEDKDGELQLWKDGSLKDYANLGFPLMQEYGSWMFQMIPTLPYNTKCNFSQIILEIRKKYYAMQSRDQIAITIPIIPFMGIHNPKEPFIKELTNSLYIDDKHVSDHPRFKTLTKHIRYRRGQNIQIFVPIFKDTHTSIEELAKTEPKEGFIHLDAMAFGMGLCCLQCTFSTKCLDHARYIYDQLNVISPLFLALTAGSPFIKGKVSDWDVRWNIVSGSVDDRTKQERDPTHEQYLPNSRYGEANYYISDGKLNLKQYNDYDTKVTERDLQNIRKSAEASGVQVDSLMANHVANLFKRDLLIINRAFRDMDEQDYTIFEMLNGTNWNSVRLKIPIDDNIGWRVQFRTMEVQLTADENSAYSLIIHLITRVLHQNTDLNLYIPITKLRENFRRAHMRDALRTQKFYFRVNVYETGEPVIEELSLHQIMFGASSFGGLFKIIQDRISGCVKVCPSVTRLMSSMRKFLEDTTSGRRLNLAQYMREYVAGHPHYKHNSILDKRVMDDLIRKLYAITKGEVIDKNFEQIFTLEENVPVMKELCVKYSQCCSCAC